MNDMLKTALVLLLGFIVGCSEDDVSQSVEKPQARAPLVTTTGAIREQAPQKRQVKAPKPVLNLVDDEDDDDEDKRTPAEKQLAKDIEKALDDENLEAALACAAGAFKSKDKEIRQAMVDTLGWFGGKAIPELTPFLADPDEDVRGSAQSEWSMAISNIEDDKEKIPIVEMAMNVLSDEDFLEDISGEYIGVDEKLAVESLVRIISSNGSAQGVAKAKETYEFVTGDEWKDAAEAERWLREEYEPPEE